MRKSMLPVTCRKCYLLLIVLLICSAGLQSQTTITTLPNPPYNGGNSLGAPGQVTFVLDNTNAGPIVITGIGNYCTTAEDNAIWQLYYSTTSLSGAVADMSAGGWALIATSFPTPVTATGITPLNFTGLNFIVPGSTQYRFALKNTNTGSIRYSGTGTAIAPNTFSDGGVNLLCGDATLDGIQVGYSGTGTGLTLAPRYFTGFVSFGPATACINPPDAGATTSSANPVCPGQNFSLSLTGGTMGTGQTYQWQTSVDGVTWTNIATATTSNLIANAAVSTWYRNIVACGTGKDTSTPLQINVNPPYNCYCGSSANNTADEEIFSVTVNGATSNYDCNTVAPGPGSVLHRYSNFYPNGPLTTLIQGAMVPFNIQEDECDGATYFSAGCAIWIDFNRDGDFDDLGEKVFVENATALGPRAIIGNIAVPIDAKPGLTGMRIIVAENLSGVNLTPCLTYGFGETEDYLVNIAAAPVCTGIPNAGVTVTSLKDACPSVPFVLSLNGVTVASGLTYQWQSSPDSISWNNIAGVNSPLYSTTASDTTWYRVIVRCGASGDTSVPVKVNVKPAFMCYCTTIPTSAIDEEIFSVTVNGSTSAYDCNTVAPGAGSILNRYSNFYPNGPLTSILPGTIVPFTILEDECDGPNYFNNGCAIWIDFNQDGDFDDAGEKVFVENATTISPRTITGNLTIPVTAKPGITGMRIIVAEGQSGAGLTPCMTYGFGETEDYLINIIPLVPCAGVPVGGTTKTNKTVVCLNEQFSLGVNGTTQASGLSYQWQVSTDNVNWTSTAAIDTLLSLTKTQTVTSWYRLKVTCVNGGGTTTSAPVQVVSPALISGDFNINNTLPTGGINFTSFNDAYNYIKCGINGKVKFTVAPGTGPYNEQLIMNAVPGASATNTITFLGNGGTISYNSVNSQERATIKLNGADFVTFDSLVIVAEGAPANYGFGVHLLNNADSNTISRCVINISLSTTSTNHAGIAVSASATSATGTGTASLCDGNSFIGNTVNGGYYGITLAGSTTTADMIKNNRIVGNKINNWYLYGIYVTGTNGTLVEGNELQRPNRVASAGTIYGIYYTGASVATRVSKNRVHSLFDNELTTVNDAHGISFNSTDGGTGANENLVSNNAIYDIKSNGLLVGIYNSSSDNTSYYHNTISLDHKTSTGTETTRGFHQITQATGIKFKNNLISLSRGGTGAQHAIYMETTATAYQSDYNNFYVTTGATRFVGFSGANRTTLADWVTATTRDSNSVSILPLYSNMAGGDFRPTEAALDNKGIFVNITTDIVDSVRSITTPDIGAFEFKVGPCVTPPTPGTAITDLTGPICPNVPFTLNINGHSIGVGQTYIWESSPSLTGTWTAISAALTYPQLDAVSSSSLYYRAIITCGANSVTTVPVLVTVNAALPGDVYTINSSQPTAGKNFHSFNDAYNAMKCGIAGKVTFNVAAGTGLYNEQLIMSAIPGASAVNTVTFKGDGVAVIGFASNNASERAVIKLKGAKHITFDSLIIQANAGTYGYGVQLMSNTDSNTVKHCTIKLSETAITENFAGIVVNGTDEGPVATGTVLSDGNTFDGNTITGGYHGITLVATFTGGANGDNKIINNTIKDFYQYGIYVAGSYGTLIENNTISRPTRAVVTNFTGIYFINQKNTRCIVSKNRISNPFGGALTSTADFYGIHFNASDGSTGTDQNIVSNNLIYNVNGNGPAYGIANTSSDNTWYFHNTISLDNATSAATGVTRGFYQTTAAGGLFFYNNLISVTRGGTGDKHCIYLNAGLIDADYNNYYMNAAGGTSALGYFNTNRPKLSDWRTTGMDPHSWSVIPAFTDPANGNYAPGNAGLDNKAFGGLGVTDDIIGVVRDINTPDIGAYEFTPPPCSTPPVRGLVVMTPDTICQYNPVYLTLNIGAFGSAQTFQWEKAKSLTGPFVPVGTPMLTPDTTIMADTTIYYRAAITCGTSTIYSDTVLLVVNPALPAGTYTINKNLPTNYIAGASTGNFNSFADAKAAMGCGIGGAVVFNVVAGTGPYLEQLRLDSIAGTTANRTITFNGNGNTIRFSSTVTGERAVIKLSGADHIIFDSLTIDAGNGTYGYGVQLISNADSNTFRKCTILTSATATNTDFAGVVISSSHTGTTTTGNTLCDGNLFDRNTITGGHYGIAVAGSTTATSFISNNKFTNNTISEFYGFGLHIAGTTNTLVEGNTFTRPTRTTSAGSVYGIYLTAAPSNGMLISKNKFSQFFGGMAATTNSFYGVYHNSVDAAASAADTVSNNLFYNLDGEGPTYGLYNLGSNNVVYLHNTISLDNTTSTATGVSVGFYQTTTATGLRFINNIVTISRGGTGAKHAIYTNTTGSEVESNFNVLYVTATNAHVGFYTANRTTLAAWRAASNKDAASFDLNPLYTDLAAGNLKPQLGAIDNKGTSAGIATDIVNVARGAAPDMGAYEFAPLPCQNPPVAGTATVTPNSGICLEVPITLNITGHSPLGTITFLWQSSGDNGVTWDTISPVQFFPLFNTVTSTNTLYRAAVTCNGVTTYTNTTAVTLNPILLAGKYTINPAGPATQPNFQSFQAAVDALLCGIGGPILFEVAPGTYHEQIRIPYIPNTSAINRVTFTSASGIASDVNLLYEGSAAANYTLKLDSTRFFTFKNMSFTDTGTAFSRVIDLANFASYDSIVNCIITGRATTSASNATAALFAAPVKGTNLVIKGNSIYNGAFGIYFTGTSAAQLATPDHIIDSNTVRDAHVNGIYAQWMKNGKLTNNTVHVTGTPVANSAGILADNLDSAARITGNIVHINDVVGVAVTGLQVSNTHALMRDSTIVATNQIKADSNNTGTVYGLLINGSKGVSAVNNVISINSSGAIAYGLYHRTNVDTITWYNNTVNLETTAATGYAGYFDQTTLGVAVNVRNNIFSNKGGGRSLFVNNPALFNADYNMLYTTGTNLVKVATGTTTDFANIATWKSTWNWDQSSISVAPAFVSSKDLHPDLNNPDVWAMHGRGVQVKGNTHDFNGKYRPDSLTAGVPDLGAYEFYPLALPTVLTAVPATPAPNTTQLFHYGSDTVMKITWGATAPAAVSIQRYSGVVPSGLLPGTDSMFFYTKVTIPGGSNYNYAAKLYYVDSWQGSIPQQNKIGLGRTTPSNAWVVGSNSKIDVRRKEIGQESIIYLDRFTGLLNPFAQPESEDSSSNRGKDFWVGYQRTNGFTGGNGGAQKMFIYMGASDIPANVTITIEGTAGAPWVKTYYVPANSALISDEIPKTGPEDARLVDEGKYEKRGIHITSDVPVVTYAHIFETTNSGATMLMPTAVWGYEYYTLSTRQFYATTGSASVFHVVAQQDSTWVEINPSRPTVNGWLPNGGTRPNGSYLVKLNKGDAYQVLGGVLNGFEGWDLTGSYVKSVANAQGKCSPIAVFAGSTRTSINCGTNTGGNGDLILQQIFPYQAWGNKYVTAPASTDDGPNATSNMGHVYRVLVKDTATIVKRNGVAFPVTDLIDKRYYQFESNTPDYIEANKPVLVAQFMASSGSNCLNMGATDGDPEMFYLSPLQQAIKRTQFYRNNEDAINLNFVTLVIPTEGLPTLKIDGVNYQAYPAADRFVYNHFLPGYSVVTKRWAAGTGSSTVESDYPFTGIVYGLGGAESYGYNLGTLVKNLNNLSTVDNAYNTGNSPTDYTCKGAPFKITALLPLVPESITWLFSQVPNLDPHVDSIQLNPVPLDTVNINGIDYYAFSVDTTFIFDTAGIIRIPIKFSAPDIERCDKTQDGAVIVQVLPSPLTDFSISFPGAICAGETATFTGDLITQNGLAISEWKWTFAANSTATGQVQTHTYPQPGTFDVKLSGLTADGCVSDTTKKVVINPIPIVKLTSEPVCKDSNIVFNVQNPDSKSTYNWYNSDTSTTAVATGVSYSVTNATDTVTYYVVQTSDSGCVSTKEGITAVLLPLPQTPVVKVDTVGTNMIRFSWAPVQGADSYEVSFDGGNTWITPSSGPTGLTHTITNLQPMQIVTIIVKAKGCDGTLSAPLSQQVFPDGIFIPNAFTPNGDGKNDVLKVYSYLIKDMHFMVFNQWGEKIFESRNQSLAWDGSYKGKTVSSGVYMYVCKMTLTDGSVVQKKGSINVIR